MSVVDEVPRFGFIDQAYLEDVGPAGFVRAIERFFLQIGFDWIQNIDGSGDAGADLVGSYSNCVWAIQCKWKKNQTLGPAAIAEVVSAMDEYRASMGMVVTNGSFASTCHKAVRDARENLGKDVTLIDGAALREKWPTVPEYVPQRELRPYQVQAVAALQSDLDSRRRALLVLATGLGKTVVAGRVIAQALLRQPELRVLVLAHTRELVSQLERSLWGSNSKYTRTQLIDGDSKPELLNGVTVATYQSAIKYVRSGFRPDFIVIDEAHNVGPNSEYTEIIELNPQSKLLGLTATPWRADEYKIAQVFGNSTYQMSLVDGINQGYLADVRYRVFVDTIDWDEVQALSENSYSVANLNRQLFLPQRDEDIRDKLLETWNQTISPRAIVFCQTIEHAEKMAQELRKIPLWKATTSLHANQTVRERKINLLRFRSGEIPVLTAVDVLNEGVDIPDVNIVCFARMTHNRKIFLQQLGRGLRLAHGKTHVEVLDFVTDIRRLKANLDLKASVAEGRGSEVLFIPGRASLGFHEETREGSSFKHWVESVADLDELDDGASLSLPGSLIG